MFEYLQGVVSYKKPDYAALDVNGVGYRVSISLLTYNSLVVGENARLYIYNHIKEDSFRLIGFLQEREKALFELLMGVKGIGVTLALSVMSTFDVDTICDLVAADDYKNLKKVPKMGEKKAQQLLLDLKGKIKSLSKLSGSEKGKASVSYLEIEEELYEALEGLGYVKKEIDGFVSREELKGFRNIEEAIKAVLKKMNAKG
ncbi:MAG: Holliday junction branch migration protein RuvA [Fusobacteriaceae bacterium]|jgi:Holliday junction DNA helicase RuvA|nr:Holliday junction branch migration protein RuvA [Fusobacteriaceae bacterium]